jgi:ribosomal protein S18 acetylase RimI-like enzyme
VRDAQADYSIRRARPGDAEDIARVQVDTWRSTYQGIVPQDFLDAMSYDRSAENWRRVIDGDRSFLLPGVPVFFHVVEWQQEVVGFANGGAERRAVSGSPQGFDAELYAIYILAQHQGHGLGKRLVQALAQDLGEAGFRALLVWVLAQNASRRFYEALGGEEADRRQIPIGGVMLEEIGYGWGDLTVLLAR